MGGGRLSRRGALPKHQRNQVSSKVHRRGEKSEEVGVGVTVGNMSFFNLVERVWRERLAASGCAGNVVRICAVIGRKAWRRAGFVVPGGGVCNVNRKRFGGGWRFGHGAPDHLGYEHQTCSLRGESTNVKTSQVTTFKNITPTLSSAW